MAMEDRTLPPISFKDGIATFIGDLAEVRTPLDPSVKDIFGHILTERDAALPPPYLTNPDQALISAATAAASLNAHETSNRLYDNAREAFVSGVHQVCEMWEHFLVNGYLNKKGQPKEANEYLHLRINGKEASKTYAESRKGDELDIGLEDFDFDFTLEIEIAPSTESQKALKYDLVRKQVMDGVATKNDLIAVNTEDVSGKVEELEEEARYQETGSVMDKFDLLHAINVVKIKTGRDYAPYFLASGGATADSADSMMGGDEGGVGGARTDPPATGTPDAGAVA